MYRIPCLLPLALIGGLIVAQLLPLPEFLLEIVSPRSHLFRQKTVAIFSDASFWPVSLDVRAGLYELARFLVCCGVYVLAVQLLADGQMLKRTVLVLVLFGGLLALSSILQSIFTVNRVLWFRTVPEWCASPFGPYVNRNNYAGLMEMLFPLGLALAFVLRPARQFGTWREKVLGFFDDTEFLWFVLVCISVVLVALSVFMSLSRGGMFGLSLGLALFLTAVFRGWPGGRGSRRTGLTLMAAIILIAIAAAVYFWYGWERIDDRLAGLPGEINTESPAGRLTIVKNGLNMIRDFPLLGAGFGAFRNVFPKYHNAEMDAFLEYAHNDYLQLLVEGGLVGAALFAVFFFCLFRTTYQGLVRRKEPYAILVCLGAGVGLAAIFWHSLVDFNLHINANALYFSFLCGLMVSAAHTRFRRHLSTATYLTPCDAKTRRLIPGVVLIAWLVVLIFGTGQWAADGMAGSYRRADMEQLTADPILRQATATAAGWASLLDPLAADYRVLAGDAAFAGGDYAGALAAYQQAVTRVPTRAVYLQKTGLTAYLAGRDLPETDALMAAGIEFYPVHSAFYQQYADFLFHTGRPAEAREIIRRGLATAPGRARQFIDSMYQAGLTPVEIHAGLIDDSRVWSAFAAFVAKTEYAFLRKEALVKAVAAAEREADPSASVYADLARVSRNENKPEEAIAVLEKGIARFPDQTGLIYELATLYEAQHITYKAVELYKKILITQPDHQGARVRLAALQK